MNEQSIGLGIQFVEVCQQPVFEVCVEVTGIQNEVRVLLEERHRERLRIVGVDEVACDILNGEEVLPRLALRAVVSDFRVERFGDPVEREAVVGREDEFLFEPEAFLEFFYVCEEVDELCGDAVNELCGFKPRWRRGAVSICPYRPPLDMC